MNIHRRPKTQKSSKYASIIFKFEVPEFAQLDLSRNASEGRFVGVAQTQQNEWKSIKITISRPLFKIDKDYNNFESFEFHRFDASRDVPETRFMRVAHTMLKPMEIKANEHL